MFSSLARPVVLYSLLMPCLPTVFGAVLNLPIWIRNTYALVEARVGTPYEPHLLLFDTGSSTTWIVDENCADSACSNFSGYPRDGYNISASSTARTLGTSAAIDYLGGITGGIGVADAFSVPSAPCMRWEQTFLAANTSSWSVLPADGFLGLAFSSIADAGTKTLVETLLGDGLLDNPRFALYYGRELNDTGGAPGEGVLTIGASEEDKYVDGELTWIEPLQQLDGQYQLWRTNMVSLFSEGVSSNGSLGPIEFGGAWAVFDTGAGGITIPDSLAVSVYESIGMNWTAIISGQHIPLCSEFTSDWSVSFQFGDYAHPATITLTGDQLARPGFADGSPDHCWPPFDTESTEGLFLFGTPYLQQLYSVFDFGARELAAYNPRIGFGYLKKQFRP